MRIQLSIGVVLLAMAIVFPGSALATLQVSSINSAMAYDTESDLYWLRDLGLFANMTYDEQIVGIASTTVAGFEWRMAGWEELDALRNPALYDHEDISSVFLHTYDYFYDPETYDGDWNYIARLDVDTPTLGHAAKGFYYEDDHVTLGNFDFWGADDPMLIWNTDYPAPGPAMYSYDNAVHLLGAWVVSNGDNSPPIPEPTTCAQLTVSLLGLGLLTWRRMITRTS